MSHWYLAYWATFMPFGLLQGAHRVLIGPETALLANVEALQWLKGEQIWDKHNIKHHVWVKTNDIKPFGTVIWHFGMQKGSKEAFSAWNGSLWTPLGCLRFSVWHECWSKGIIPITQTGRGSHQGCVAVVGMGIQEWEGHRDSRGADHLLPTGKWKWNFYHFEFEFTHLCADG